MKNSLNLRFLGESKTYAVTLFLFLMLAPFVHGQSAVRSITYNAQTKFSAGGKSFPVGTYKVSYEARSKYITLRAASGAVTQLNIITRLASEIPNATSRLVFDVLGSERVLSEVWIAGEDGFLVASTQGEHGHQQEKDLK